MKIERRRVAVHFEKPTLARGSFKEECDVNNIVETYARTGMVNHVARAKPQYGDAPDIDFYQAALVHAEIASMAEEEALSPEPAQEEPEEAPEAPAASEEVLEPKEQPGDDAEVA